MNTATLAAPDDDPVIIGMDPHKRSATIDVLDRHERSLAVGRYSTDTDGYRDMLIAGRKFPQRVWAVEGAGGVGKHLAQRLLADGEPVLDVPAKLSAKVRVFSTGNGRKTDASDARSIAVAALRAPQLRPVTADDETVALRLLADHRDQLGVRRTQIANRVHKLFAELVPGGAKKSLTAAQAKKLLDLLEVDVVDVAGRTRWQLLGTLVEELAGIDQSVKSTDKNLRELIAATGSHLMDLYGLGPASTARLLGDVGDISRFKSKGHFASWNGTAPLDVSSGDNDHQRLSRAGNRRLNRVLHTMATTQIRRDTEGRRYYERKKAEGKSSMEALRALKRRLSDVVYRQMVADTRTLADVVTDPEVVTDPDVTAVAPTTAVLDLDQTGRAQDTHAPSSAGGEQLQTGPGGHSGATTDSSAADSNPNIDASEKSLPGPAEPSSTDSQAHRNITP